MEEQRLTVASGVLSMCGDIFWLLRSFQDINVNVEPINGIEPRIASCDRNFALIDY